MAKYYLKFGEPRAPVDHWFLISKILCILLKSALNKKAAQYICAAFSGANLLGFI